MDRKTSMMWMYLSQDLNTRMCPGIYRSGEEHYEQNENKYKVPKVGKMLGCSRNRNRNRMSGTLWGHGGRQVI